MFILIIFFIIILIIYDTIYKHTISIRRNIDINLRKKILTELYNILITSSNETNTKPFLLYGTLLGYIRNKDFICYDFDIDIGILSNEYNILCNHLINNIKTNYPNYKIRNKKIFGYRHLEIYHKETLINLDISAFKIQDNKIYRNVPIIQTYIYDKNPKYKYPLNIYLPLKEIIFKNHKIYIPNQSEKLLEHYYGKNYLIPDHICNNDCSKCIKK